jgi:hypothetical protein
MTRAALLARYKSLDLSIFLDLSSCTGLRSCIRSRARTQRLAWRLALKLRPKHVGSPWWRVVLNHPDRPARPGPGVFRPPQGAVSVTLIEFMDGEAAAAWAACSSDHAAAASWAASLLAPPVRAELRRGARTAAADEAKIAAVMAAGRLARSRGA